MIRLTPLKWSASGRRGGGGGRKSGGSSWFGGGSKKTGGTSWFGGGSKKTNTGYGGNKNYGNTGTGYGSYQKKKGKCSQPLVVEINVPFHIHTFLTHINHEILTTSFFDRFWQVNYSGFAETLYCSVSYVNFRFLNEF